MQAGSPQRSDHLPAGGDWDAQDCEWFVVAELAQPRLPAIGAAAHRNRDFPDLDPAGLLVGGTRLKCPARGHRWSGLAGSRVGNHALLGNGIADADPDAGHFGLAHKAGSQYRRGLERGCGRRDVAAQGEHRASLGATQLRLAAALELQGTEPADGDGHDQEQLERRQTPHSDGDDEEYEQVDPLVRRGDGKRVIGLDEEEVVQQKRSNRGADCQPAAVAHPHGHHGEQVDRHRRSAQQPFQGPDEQRGYRQAGSRGRQTRGGRPVGPDFGEGASQHEPMVGPAEPAWQPASTLAGRHAMPQNCGAPRWWTRLTRSDQGTEWHRPSSDQPHSAP